MAETAASTAYGPMVIIAIEQTLPRSNASWMIRWPTRCCPLYMRLMVRACALKPLGRRSSTSWRNPCPVFRMVFRAGNAYIDEKITELLDDSIEFSRDSSGPAWIPSPTGFRSLQVCGSTKWICPKTSATRRNGWKRSSALCPRTLRLIPTNFEDQALEKALRQGGYGFYQTSVFVWEAVTQYLTEAAVRDTFRLLAKAKPGSRLIFTVRPQRLHRRRQYLRAGFRLPTLRRQKSRSGTLD